MSALRRDVLTTLKDAGVTRREYVEHWFGPGGPWGGDVCGCPDDRCIGYHHDDTDDCQCLPVCLAEVREANR